jgi:hypothetical protein
VSFTYLTKAEKRYKQMRKDLSAMEMNCRVTHMAGDNHARPPLQMGTIEMVCRLKRCTTTYGFTIPVKKNIWAIDKLDGFECTYTINLCKLCASSMCIYNGKSFVLLIAWRDKRVTPPTTSPIHGGGGGGEGRCTGDRGGGGRAGGGAGGTRQWQGRRYRT